MADRAFDRLEGDQIVTDFVHPQEVRTLQKFNLSAGNGYIVPFRRIEFDMATATIDGHTYKMSILFEMLAGQHAKLGAHLGHSPGLKLMHLLAKEAKCFFYHYQLYLVHVDLIPISRPWRDLTFLVSCAEAVSSVRPPVELSKSSTRAGEEAESDKREQLVASGYPSQWQVRLKACSAFTAGLTAR